MQSKSAKTIIITSSQHIIYEYFSYVKYMTKKTRIIHYMSVGKNIRQLRKEKNLTQTELAKLLFTSQDTISLWELDKSLPDVLSIIKMTKIFNVTSDYILDIEK